MMLNMFSMLEEFDHKCLEFHMDEVKIKLHMLRHRFLEPSDGDKHSSPKLVSLP